VTTVSLSVPKCAQVIFQAANIHEIFSRRQLRVSRRVHLPENLDMHVFLGLCHLLAELGVAARRQEVQKSPQGFRDADVAVREASVNKLRFSLFLLLKRLLTVQTVQPPVYLHDHL
jgi:hypothetical protein